MSIRYFFLDEAGNLDFSPKGTKFYVFTCISTDNVSELMWPLHDMKHELIKNGHDIEYFHASEDRQSVRDKVFAVLNSAKGYAIDSLIVEKAKTHPSLQDIKSFYPRMYQYLLKYIFKRAVRQNITQYVIFTDAIPVEKNREAIEKGMKTSVKSIAGNNTFSVYHHASKSHFYLQVADYCCWAIYKKWNLGDKRSYVHIEDKVQSEFNIFAVGRDLYY